MERRRGDGWVCRRLFVIHEPANYPSWRARMKLGRFHQNPADLLFRMIKQTKKRSDLAGIRKRRYLVCGLGVSRCWTRPNGPAVRAFILARAVQLGGQSAQNDWMVSGPKFGQILYRQLDEDRKPCRQKDTPRNG